MKGLEALKEEVVALAREPSLRFFDLAVKLDALHETGDPSLLADLPSLSGIRRRRMYYLLEVGRLIRQQKLSQGDAAALGWTKLKVIARHLSGQEVSEHQLRDCIKLARGIPARSLSRALCGQQVPRDCAVQFTLGEKAKAELETALLAFGATRSGNGLIGREAALARILATALEKSAFEA